MLGVRIQRLSMAVGIVLLSISAPAVVCSALTLNPPGVPPTGVGPGVTTLRVNADGLLSTLTPEVLPSSDSTSSSSTRTSISLDYSLSENAFSFATEHSVGTTGGSSFGAYVYFSVDVPTNYAFSGFLELDDPVGRQTSLYVDLRSIKGHLRFYNRQSSAATPMESFVLGGTSGDEPSRLYGSPTGVLFPGTYLLQTVTTLQNGHLSSAPATGSGFVLLSLAPVPEPSSGSLLLGGGLLLGLHRRLGRRPGKV